MSPADDNTPRIRVLILDDDLGPEDLPTDFRSSNIDIDFVSDVEEMRQCLERGAGAFSGARDLVVLDSLLDGTTRGWRTFALKIRARYPDAWLYLASSLPDDNLDDEFRPASAKAPDVALAAELEDLVNLDPRVVFLPKPPASAGQTAHHMLISVVLARANELLDDKLVALRLMDKMADAIADAYGALLGEPVLSLVATRSLEAKPVDPPHCVDLLLERAIQRHFLPEVQACGLVLATEEEGIQNILYRKVTRPRYFLFSDPFDGSSAFCKAVSAIKLEGDLPNAPSAADTAKVHKLEKLTVLIGALRVKKASLGHVLDVLTERAAADAGYPEWAANLVDKLAALPVCKLTFSQFRERVFDDSAGWRKYGPWALNAPMLSITLAEPDGVLASIVLNTFTGEAYVSRPDTGNRRYNLGGEGLAPGEYGEFLRGPGSPLAWADTSKAVHLLAQLKAKPLLDSGQSSATFEHFSSCVREMLGPVEARISVDDSLLIRYARNDFSPGPGRILFLMEEPARAYYGGSPDGVSRTVGTWAAKVHGNDENLDFDLLLGPGEPILERYRLIAANGEPITEWIHWFAFLRNGGEGRPVALRLAKPCAHKWKPDTLVSMAPADSASVFRNSSFDLGRLFSAYFVKSHRYTDTIVVCDRHVAEIFERGVLGVRQNNDSPPAHSNRFLDELAFRGFTDDSTLLSEDNLRKAVREVLDAMPEDRQHGGCSAWQTGVALERTINEHSKASRSERTELNERVKKLSIEFFLAWLDEPVPFAAVPPVEHADRITMARTLLRLMRAREKPLCTRITLRQGWT
jgi:hypothetical protein